MPNLNDLVPALGDISLRTSTQRQPEEQAESYHRPSASSSSVVPVASSHLDPSVSRHIVAPAPSVRQPAPGYSDPRMSMPAVVPAPSLPYPVPVSQSSREDISPLVVPRQASAPISASPAPASQNNPSTDAVSETTQADDGGQDITDHGTTNNTRTSVPVDSALRSELSINGRFLDPEIYDPVKLIGSGGFAKVILITTQYFVHPVVKNTQACCLNNH